MKGKDYLSRKNRPEGDFYPIPKSLVWVAEEIIRNEFGDISTILEPAAGKGSISEELEVIFPFCNIRASDLYSYTFIDYLNHYFETEYVITNPPFSLWDEFVLKAKTHCKKIMFIGRLNYFGTQSRLKKEIWEGLKGFYPFSRYVDYRTPPRADGHFHVGGMATAWFLWEKGYSGKKDFEILDVQKYATLGNYKELNHE